MADSAEDYPLLEGRQREQSLVRRLLRKQPIPSTDRANEVGALKRELSIIDLITYGISSTLGTGILVTVGSVAHQTAGPGVVLSFILAGFAAFLSAMCYSEFAARIPVSGSAYSFAYISLGEVVAWFVGWNLTLEYAISASAVASGWASYVQAAFHSIGINIPTWLAGYQLNSLIFISPLSALIVLLCTLVLLLGMKESAKFNLVMTIVNIVVILFFIIAGSFYVDTKNWDPFFPYKLAGTWAGVGKVFFSYIGFDSVSTLAGEVKNPTRDLPVGIVGTLLVVTGLYVVVSLVLTGMQKYSCIDLNAPLAIAFYNDCNNIHISWISTAIAFGSVTTITATCLCSLIGQPRIFYQMAQDGLMFQIFGKVNAKTGVPMEGTIITGLISALIALFFDLDILLDMISIGTLLAFTVVCGGVIVLRYQPPLGEVDESERGWKIPLIIIGYFIGCVIFATRQKFDFEVTLAADIIIWIVFATPMLTCFILLLIQPHLNIPTTFKTPLVPWIPCGGILMNIWFILSLSIDSIYRLLIWTFIGMSIYFFYSFRNSKLAKRRSSVIQ